MIDLAPHFMAVAVCKRLLAKPQTLRYLNQTGHMTTPETWDAKTSCILRWGSDFRIQSPKIRFFGGFFSG